MSLSINTNTSASVSASNLNSTNTMLQKSLQRLSSGTRIVDSSDDAGGLAVSMKMSAAIRRTEATNTNLSNAQSFLKTQDGAFATATKVLTRMSELSTLSQDVTKTTNDTANYQTEFAALQTQLTALGAGTFNGVAMFAGAATAGSTSTVYTNEDSSTSTTITKAALLGDASMAAAIGATTATVATVAGATAATATINTALSSLATMRAQNGSEASKLKFGQEMLTTNKNNLEAANSRIIDVDVAAESTQLARFNILQQAGTAMLAQANQTAQSVLRLLS